MSEDNNGEPNGKAGFVGAFFAPVRLGVGAMQSAGAAVESTVEKTSGTIAAVAGGGKPSPKKGRTLADETRRANEAEERAEAAEARLKAMEASLKAMEARVMQMLENEAKVAKLLEDKDRSFQHTQEMAVRRVMKRDLYRGWLGWMEFRRLEILKRQVASRFIQPKIHASFDKWRKDWEGDHLARAAAKVTAKAAAQREEAARAAAAAARAAEAAAAESEAAKAATAAAKASATAAKAETVAAVAKVSGANEAATEAVKRAEEVAVRNATLSLEKERYIEHTANMAANRWVRGELRRAWLCWWVEWRATWEVDLTRIRQSGPTFDDILARKVATKLAELYAEHAEVEEAVERRPRNGELMSEAQLRFARKDAEVAVAWAKSATEYAEEEAQRADVAEARAREVETLLEGFDSTEYTTKESFAIIKSTEAMERAARAMAKAEAAEAAAVQRTELAVEQAAKAEAATAKAQADAAKAKDLVKYLALKDAKRAVPAAPPSPRR